MHGRRLGRAFGFQGPLCKRADRLLRVLASLGAARVRCLASIRARPSGTVTETLVSLNILQHHTPRPPTAPSFCWGQLVPLHLLTTSHRARRRCSPLRPARHTPTKIFCFFDRLQTSVTVFTSQTDNLQLLLHLPERHLVVVHVVIAIIALLDMRHVHARAEPNLLALRLVVQLPRLEL